MIPRSKCIPVEEFLPEWTAFMERYLKEDKTVELQHKHDLDINEPDRCLVGEAHLFKEIRCEYCVGLATGAITTGGGISYYQALKTLTKFYRFKQGLYDHFIESHREKLVKK